MADWVSSPLVQVLTGGVLTLIGGWTNQHWESMRAETTLRLREASSFLEQVTLTFEAERRYVLLHNGETIQGKPEAPDMIASVQLLETRAARLAMAVPELNAPAQNMVDVVQSFYVDLWEADWPQSFDNELEDLTNRFKESREAYLRAALKLSGNESRLTTR